MRPPPFQEEENLQDLAASAVSCTDPSIPHDGTSVPDSATSD
jgi:hypothetical protein